MGIVGVLHSRVGRSTTGTEVFVAATGTPEALGESYIYHEHSYFYTEAKKQLVDGTRIDKNKRRIMQGSALLYKASEPFVIVPVTANELDFVVNSYRLSLPGFVEQVVVKEAVIQYLTEKTYENDLLDAQQRDAIVSTLRRGTYLGRRIEEYANVDAVRRDVDSRIRGFQQTFRDHIASQTQPKAEEDLDATMHSIGDVGFETIKELSVLKSLLYLKTPHGTKRDSLNEDDHPHTLLDMVGLH